MRKWEKIEGERVRRWEKARVNDEDRRPVVFLKGYYAARRKQKPEDRRRKWE